VTLNQAESFFYQELTFRPRDENRRIDMEIKPIELTMSDYISGGFVSKATFNQIPESFLLLGA